MDTVKQLQETRSGRRFLKREVARRSRCPFCGTSGERMPDFRAHIRKHLERGDKQNPEFK